MSSEVIATKTGTMKLWYLFIATLVMLFDQITKYWVSVKLREGDEIDIIQGFFKFSYTENPGIAFGMLNNGNVKWLLVSVSVAAIAVVFYYMRRTPVSNTLLLWSLALLSAGDTVIVGDPAYPIHMYAVTLAGGSVMSVPLGLQSRHLERRWAVRH